jgi:hypothetical protein
MEIQVGGSTLELPDGASQEAIKRAIAHYRSTPEFDAAIDKESGAPARVRMLVGSAPEGDKLANLKRFYPDATPHGEGNFVFTDPGTGKPTLYNPKGLDLGDVAGVAREASQAVGGALGAAFGGAGGLVVGAPAGPGAALTATKGAVIGAGLGTAAGGQLFDAAVEFFHGRIDSRSLAARTADAGLDVAAGAAGQRAGELLETGVKVAVGGLKPAAQRLVESFRALNVPAPAGAVSGSRAVATVEKALDATPGSADIMQKQAETVLAQTKAAADALTAEFGKARTTQGAGEVIKQAAKNTAERFGFRQNEIYTEAFDLIGAETPVMVPMISALRAEMKTELSRAPNSLAPGLSAAIAKLEAIEADAAAGIPFGALRDVRTAIGKDLANPVLVGSSGSANSAMKRVYGALTEDMSEAAKQAGPEAAQKLAVADRYTRSFMTTAAKTMEKLAGFEADERAFTFALQSARDGGTALTRMRRHFLPEEWDDVAASVLARLGKATAGAQDAGGEVFSVSTFMTNWNRLAPEAKTALFGGKRYAELRPQLDKLVDVVSSLKGTEKLANTSNTARNLIAFSTINLFGGALGAFFTGDVSGAGSGMIMTLAGSVVAPRVAARLITSPRFVAWLIEPVTKANGVSAHVARLAAIAVAEPEIKEEIQQFAAALRSLP